MGKQVKGWVPPEDAVEVSEQPKPKVSTWVLPEDAIEVKKKDNGSPSLPGTGQGTTSQNGQSTVSGGLKNTGEPLGFLGSLEAAYNDFIASYNTPAEEGIQRPTPIKNAIKRGINLGSQAEIISPFSNERPTDEKLQQLATIQKENQELPASPAYDKFNQSKTVKESLLSLSENPVQIIGELTVESLSGLANYGASRMALGAGTGAAIGSVVPGIGTAAGAGSGVIAGLADTSLALEFTGSFIESLQDAGVDVTDPEQLSRAFEDDKLISEARTHAYKKGIPIAIFDLISGGIAGKIVSKPAKSLVGKVALGAGELGVQGTMGGAGETAGQLMAGEQLNPSAIIAEIIGELGTTPVEVSANLLGRTKALVDKAKSEPTQQNEELQKPPGEVGGQGAVQQDAPQENIQAQQGEEETTEGQPTATAQPEITEPSQDVKAEVEPIRQLGTGANVYFETEKHRVNDDLKSGKVLLNIGSKDDAVPIANIEFDNASDAVKIAERVSRDYPQGVPDAVLVDKYIDGLKRELLEGISLKPENQNEKERQKEEGLLSPKQPETVAGEPTALNQQEDGTTNQKGDQASSEASPQEGQVAENAGGANVLPASTPKGPYQIEVEARVKKAEEAVRSATEAYENKKKQLGKSMAQDQMDLLGNRIGDEGKLFQEGAADRGVAKKQLDTLKSNIDKAKQELDQAKKDLQLAEQADSTTLFDKTEQTVQKYKGERAQDKMERNKIDLRDEDEYNDFVANESENAVELAEHYILADELENVKEYKDQILDENFKGIRSEDFAQYHDANAVSPLIGKKFFDKKATELDAQAEDLSVIAGVEITPQDIIDYIVAFEKKESTKKYKIKQKLKQRFAEITDGDDLTPALAKRIIKQQDYVSQNEKVLQSTSGRSVETDGGQRQSQERAGQRGLAERIRSKIRSLRASKSPSEQEKLAKEIVDETGKYLLNREGVITGSDASFADKNSPTFFNLIDEGKSVYLMDPKSKIAETAEDYKRINAELQDKVAIVNGSLMFDDAFSKGAVQAAKDLGYDAIRLTEIDGTNSTLQVLNFDKLTHVAGKDFVSERATPPTPPAKTGIPQGRDQSGRKPLSVIERTTDKVKELIKEIFDGTYDPESNKETFKVTKEFISKIGGIDNAFDARNSVAPNVRRIIFAEYMQSLEGRMDEDPANQSKYREAMIELAQLAKSEGQATQIMDFIYSNYGTMFTYENQLLKYVNDDPSQLDKVPDDVRRMLKELADKHKQLEKDVAELNKKNQELEDKIALFNIQQSIKRGSIVKTQRSKQHIKEAQEERAKLWKELTKLSSARAEIIPVTAITYGVKIANTYLKEGVANVEIAIEKTKEFWRKATGKEFSKEELEAIRQGIDPEWEFSGIKVKSSLIRSLVEEGYNTIETLTEKVKEILISLGHENITDRQVRDIISGYGRMINPSQDEVQALINKIKQAGRFASQLEDVLSGVRPKKSGLQREKLTPEERAHIKRINRLLKDLPLDEATKDSDLRTALDAKKQRLKNKIEDLQLAMDEGQKIKKNERIITDDEVKDLEQQVKDISEVYNAVFDEGISDNDKIDKAINALDKSIDRALDRINALKDEIYTAEKDKVSSKDVQILKDRLAKINEFRNFLLEETGIAELNRINRLLANAKKTEERMKLALATGNFSRRVIKPNYLNYNLAIDEAELDIQKKKLQYAETPVQRKEIQFNIDLLTKRIDSAKKLQKKRGELAAVRDQFLKAQYAKELQDRKTEEKIFDGIVSLIFDFTRGLKAGFDLSIVMIQTMLPTVRFMRQDSVKFAKTLFTQGESIKDFESLTKKHLASAYNAIKSEKGATQQALDISQSEMYDLAKEMGVKISLTDPKAQATEEALQFTGFQRAFGMLVKKIGKGLQKIGLEKTGKFVEGANPPRAFERASHDYAGIVRLELFSQLAMRLKREGKNPIDNREEFKKIAKYVNSASGQSSLGNLSASSRVLSYIFFSAKLIAQSIKYATPYAFIHYYKLGNADQTFKERAFKPSVAQKAFLEDYVYSLGIQYMLMHTMIAVVNAGIGDDDDKWSIEDDPRSSKFGQIRIPGEDGKATYVSPFGPYRTMMTFMARQMTGEMKRRSGEVSTLGSGSVPSRLMLGVDFGLNKLAPTPALAADLMDLRIKKDRNRGTYTYTDKYGNEYIFENEATLLTIPMYATTIKDAFDSNNPALAAGLTALAFFGVGVNTYDESPKKKK